MVIEVLLFTEYPTSFFVMFIKTRVSRDENLGNVYILAGGGGEEYCYEQNFKSFLLYVVYTKNSELLAKVIELKLQPINVRV